MTGIRGPHAQHLVAMRRNNTVACVEVLREQQSCTVGFLARRTGLSRPTVESILGELAAYGLVAADTTTEPDAKGAGRPARVFSFQADAYVVASIDVGLHRTSGMLADLRGNVVAAIRHDTAPEMDAAQRTAQVGMLTRELLEKGKLPAAGLHTAVVSVPGIVDAAGRMVLSNPIPEWTGVNLKARFEDSLPAGVHVVVENDVNMAALAEHRLGAGRLADDLFFIHIGYRMNAALVLDGQLRRGHHYSAGEIGDLHRAQWNLAAGTDDGEQGWKDPSLLLSAAAAGEQAAIEAIRTFADRIAFTIAVTNAAIDPQLIVIGGGLSGSGETLVRPIRDAVGSFFRSRMMPEIVVSQLGGDGVTLGGLVRGLQEINAEVYHAPQMATPAITIKTPSTQSPGKGRK